ncbi:hypothetical protein CkaCkLH20_02981 [Colletotrichum karsti]|uniref:Uncharacterized protein n=1 Tax=Colletotrichum karsti TaxID=1095194 RepID=A0A9P6IAP8_9PEZI|nr:uncharacterized protein CkaCkLH20_02981 [Colletotrichum karsti]KAF9879438.1 hypothetical protein CkaCkLH20_02981 [Colletotrichum karsti]
MSPESVSSLFPQRPIRPLPKRRLRERLSPEVADSIEYPPANHNSSPLFYYPNIVRDETPSRSGGLHGTRRGGGGYENSPRGNAGNGESDEEELALSSSKVVRRSHPEILNRATGLPSKSDQSKHPNPQPPPSTTSSADGYESFENTNNKKKRKIPTAGDSALSGAHSLADMSSMGVSAATSPSIEHGDLAGSASPSYYGGGSFVANNQGISGPGRGRFGRSRNGRSPLRALSDANNNWVGRGAKIRPPQWATPNENPGIISSAIANAEKLPSAPGQENVSLLQQHSSSVKSSPTASQFTFTCDSPVPKPQWPGTDPTGAHGLIPGYANKPKHSMATQTSTEPAGTNAGASAAAPGKGGAQPGTKKKSRRRAEKELKMAAKHRRQEAQYRYRTDPPKPEDMWICEFCEYERIFGEPPYALIRQYEIKDQKARHKEKEQKRLLELAKTKGRKGKKPAKSPGKATSTQNQQQASQPEVPMAPMASNSTHDDYPNDEYPHDDYSNEVEEEEELDDAYSHSQDDPPMVLSDDPDSPECINPNCETCRGPIKEVDDPGDSGQPLCGLLDT